MQPPTGRLYVCARCRAQVSSAAVAIVTILLRSRLLFGFAPGQRSNPSRRRAWRRFSSRYRAN